MVSGVMDINSDPGYGRAMDPDMTSTQTLAWKALWPQVSAESTQIGMALVVTALGWVWYYLYVGTPCCLQECESYEDRNIVLFSF